MFDVSQNKKMKKTIIILTIISIGLFSSWYFDIWNKSVEPIDELIGKNYDYAHKLYFKTDPDQHYKININDQLNEFNGGVYNKKSIFTDSIINVYTWISFNHKQTIWVGKTKKSDNEIIDAIRHKNGVKF